MKKIRLAKYISCMSHSNLRRKSTCSGPKSHPRCFQSNYWFQDFPWLEYSPTKYVASFFPCYSLSKKPSAKAGWDVFIIVKGFNS
jgi:hypothetical protein